MYLQDWEFHQATGMVAVQVGTHDMTEAALWLVAASAEIDESPHETAMRVIERRLRLGQGDGCVPSGGAATSSITDPPDLSGSRPS
jgi:hypothetical protein